MDARKGHWGNGFLVISMAVKVIRSGHDSSVEGSKKVSLSSTSLKQNYVQNICKSICRVFVYNIFTVFVEYLVLVEEYLQSICVLCVYF